MLPARLLTAALVLLTSALLAAVPASAVAAPACMTRNLHHMDAVGAGPGAAVLYDRDERGHRRAARRIATEIRTRIYPRFKKLLGRTPPSDARERCFHGPDGRFDVYVTNAREIAGLEIPKGVAAIVHPYPRNKHCAPRQPAIAIVRPGIRNAILAHEVFHGFQAAYDTAQACIFYGEWEEATATWAGDWIYPRDDVEHTHTAAFRFPSVPLLVLDYAGWVFPRYLSEKLGPSVVRRIEEAKALHRAGEHVDAAIPGGFRTHFPAFGVYAFNQAPLPGVPGVGPSFRAWDRLPHAPRADRVPLRLNGSRTASAAVRVNRMRLLSREYRQLVVEDPRIRRVTFENPQAATPRLHVRALVQRGDGSWTSENWDGRERVEFCRDAPGQDVRQIVLVLAHSEHRGRARVTPTPSVKLEDTCALQYRVLSASLSNRTVASGEHIFCGGESGTKLFDGAASGLPFDGRSRIEQSLDRVRGEIEARVPAQWHGHHLDGCKDGNPGWVPCSADMAPRTPGGDGRWPVSFSVSGRWDDPEWELRWALDDPEVGFVDAGDDECNVHLSGAFTDGENVRREARATFMRTDPVTLVFEGSGRPGTIIDGANATIEHAWRYSLTFQRVDADGRPFG